MKNDKTIVTMVASLFFIIAIFHIYYSYLKVEEEQKNFALTESRILNDFMFIHREYYQKLFINKNIELNEKTLPALPAYSSYDISEKFSNNNKYNIKVQTVSDRARNPKNQADGVEGNIIEYFKNNPDKKEYFEFIDDSPQKYYQYGYALRIEKNCLQCHSSKEKAPKFIAQKYSKAYDYKLGDVRGIISVKVPKEHTHNHVHDRFINNIIYNIVTLIFIFVVTILIILKRTKDIKELKYITEQANNANRAKSEFLANMSHEVRTPLNAILGFVSILKEEENDKNKLKYLNTIDSSSQSLLGVINDIFDFSKIESGKLEIDKINFNPKKEFESIASLFCAKSEEKQLYFSTYIDENLPPVLFSDPLRLKQILSNLLSNAIKFTQNGGSVDFSIKYIKEQNKLRFSVKDNGIGISEEYKKSLFNPFTQEQSSTTREYGGTGLGLTISFRLLQILGSELQVNSETAKGTEFFFELSDENLSKVNLENINLLQKNLIDRVNIATLFLKENQIKKETIQQYLNALGLNKIKDINRFEELNGSNILIIDSLLFDKDKLQDILNKGIVVVVIKASLSRSLVDGLKGKIIELECPIVISDFHNLIIKYFTENKQNIDSKAKDSKSFSFKDKKLLLVEDNKANQMFMKVVLKKLQLEFDIANDGVEAVDMYRLNSYDVILMDENMPNMNGIEATKRILEIEKELNLPHTPIIALTANAIKGDRERFLEAGMDEYLTKPINKEKLAQVLGDFLYVK